VKCIICLQERPESQEHIFPAAIGGTLEITRVCADCNRTLGHTADLSLTSHPFVMITAARCLNDLELSARILGRGVLQDVEMEDVEAYQVAKKDGPFEIRIIPKVKRSADGKELRAVFGSDKIDNAKGLLRSFLLKHGHRLSETEFEVFFEQNAQRITYSHPQTKHSFVITMEHCSSVSFGHGVIKIAYEFAWRSLGDAWLEDVIARKMRSALEKWPSNAEGIKGRYSMLGQEELPFADHLGARQGDTLAVGLMTAGGRIVLGLRVFDLIRSVLPLSEQAERYLSSQPWEPYGPAVIIDVAKAIHREISAGEAVAEWMAEKNEPSSD